MSRSRIGSLGLAVWAVPAALATLQSYLLDNPLDCGGSLWRSLVREASPWLVWAAVTPLLLRAGRSASLIGSHRARRIGYHVVAMIGIAVAFGTVNGVAGYLVRATPPTLTLAGQLEMSIIDWLPIQPLVYAGVIAVGMVVEGARRRREDDLARAQLETQLATAQLAALRAQIQPHFLFNTLNAAVALARAGDNDGCARVLVLLGELLHQLLRDEAPHEVPLHEELALVERYLEIQRVRFGDRLRVDFAIDDALRDALVPQLVLQPLVENAFRHGLSQRSLSGKLDIQAARHGDALELTVRDDGPGPSASFAFGVGLRNTGERLRKLYGDKGLVTLTGGSGGAIAAVTLPLHTEPVSTEVTA